MLASVKTVPASHSIGISALDRLGGTEKLVYLVRKDEPLPKKGTINFRAALTLKATADESLNFNIWEGEIETPYQDNRFAGVYRISSADLSGNEIIPAGSEIVCSYEISDGGAISMYASVPCIGHDFTGRNFYSHDDAKIDLSDTYGLAKEGRDFIEQIDDISRKIDDPDLDRARQKAENAAAIDSSFSASHEEVQEAYNDLYEAKKILSRIRKEHLSAINQMELDDCVEFFNGYVSRHAADTEKAAFNNLARTAKRYVNDSGFERYISELWGKAYGVLFRQDWYIIEYFRARVQNPSDYRDKKRFEALKAQGEKCIAKGEINTLRGILYELFEIMKNPSQEDKQLGVNIING